MIYKGNLNIFVYNLKQKLLLAATMFIIKHILNIFKFLLKNIFIKKYFFKYLI